MRDPRPDDGAELGYRVLDGVDAIRAADELLELRDGVFGGDLLCFGGGAAGEEGGNVEARAGLLSLLAGAVVLAGICFGWDWGCLKSVG